MMRYRVFKVEKFINKVIFGPGPRGEGAYGSGDQYLQSIKSVRNSLNKISILGFLGMINSFVKEFSS